MEVLEKRLQEANRVRTNKIQLGEWKGLWSLKIADGFDLMEQENKLEAVSL